MPDGRPLSEITAEAVETLAEIGHGVNCRAFRGGECNCGYQATADLLAELSGRLDGAGKLIEAAERVAEDCYQTNAVENTWSYGPVIVVEPFAWFALKDALALCGRPGKETE